VSLFEVLTKADGTSLVFGSEDFVLDDGRTEVPEVTDVTD
jgi:hypothetical protein